VTPSSAMACSLCALMVATSGCLTATTNEISGPGGGTTSATPHLCNPACGANTTCNPDGTCSCYPNYTGCPTVDGGMACTQVLLDNDNCNGCGVVCPEGESCLGGECTCHQTTCNDDGGSVCTDPEIDPLNCGNCGHVCPEGENCVLGECSCMPSLTIAECATDGGLVCVDLTQNPDFPGCGIFMPTGCEGCELPDAGGDPGAAVCCQGACVTFFDDPSNCGACGNLCISGSCIPGDAGQGICNCPLPYTQCGPTCVNTYADVNHCGNCTRVCSPPATQCMLGNCQ
jgi:hypothetical protein